MVKLIYFGASFIVVFCSVLFVMQMLEFPLRASAEISGIKSINAAEIPDRAAIIGKLGLPIGQLRTIKGKWIENREPKGADWLFQVTQIDGKAVNKPIEIEAYPYNMDGTSLSNWPTDGWAERVAGWDWAFRGKGKLAPPKPQRGAEWEMRGMESGFLGGVSEEIADECGFDKNQAMAPFRFYVNFRFIKLKSVSKEDEKKNR